MRPRKPGPENQQNSKTSKGISTIAKKLRPREEYEPNMSQKVKQISETSASILNEAESSLQLDSIGAEPIEPIGETIQISNNSRSSRITTRDQLKLLDEESKMAEREFEAQKEYFAMQKEIMRQRRELLQRGSQGGTSLSSVSLGERRANTENWLNKNVNHVHFESVPAPEILRPSNNMTEQLLHKHPNTQLREEARDVQRNQFEPTLSWLRPSTTEQQFLDSTVAGDASMARSLNLTKSQLQARLVIPKEIPQFSGDPKYWPQFITTFINSTQQCGFTAEENMARLSKCLKGDAYNAVRTDLLMPSSLGTVLSTLRMLYGRPELIFNSAMEQIKQTPPVKLERLETIVAFSMRVKAFCDIVKTANMNEYLINPTLLSEMVDKLPSMLKLEWGRHRRLVELDNPVVTIEVFNVWLRGNAETASSLSSQPVGTLTPIKSNRKLTNTEAFHGAHATTAPKSNAVNNETPKGHCRICKSVNHVASQCREFLSLPVVKRWNEVRQKNLCVGCLGNHWLRDCRTKSICGVDSCHQPHHALLHSVPKTPNSTLVAAKFREPSSPAHRNNLQSTSAAVVNATTENSTQANIGTTQQRIHVHYRTKLQAYYQIVPVVLYGKAGQTVSTYAFLDGGSTATLLEREVADDLGLEGVPESLTLRWTNEITRNEEHSCKVSLHISGQYLHDRYELQEVRTTEQLCLPIQSIGQEVLNKFSHLRDLGITTYTKIQPRILIGLDHYQLLVPQKIISGGWEDPVALLTRIGWTLQGGAQEMRKSTHYASVNHHTALDDNLHEYVKGFFALESIGVKIPEQEVESHENARAKQILMETVRRKNDGRYESGLLWRSDGIKLPASRQMAMHRLLTFERKLSKDQEAAKNVEAQILEYKEKGWLKKLSDEEARSQGERTWYLPIFAVSNPNKPGKTRLVWDAAATVNGTSLNSNLLTGPDLLANLVAVLLKFREHKYAICGDIRQMFHQIGIKREDQDAQRCLWRDRPHEEVSTYQMTVMTFGASCSPSTAQYVKNLNADRHQEQKPRAVEAIKNRHYVDDYLDSFEKIEECVEVTRQVIGIHREGGFDLRNCISNSPKVLKSINPVQSQTEKLLGDSDESTKVLGMLWCTSDDTLQFRANIQRMGEEIMRGDKVPTKRAVLRIVMMVFDPLGLIGFFIVQGKLILKEIWRTGVDWDEQIKPDQMRKWSDWIRALPVIETIRLPRCYFANPETHTHELHIFVDASEHAAAAVVYLVRQRHNGHEVSFVTSKTKVAPNKAISIPRMELQAAVLGARLANSVKNQQAILITKSTYWSDSRNVLCWLRSPRTFKPFVAHRVGEILESTNCNDWRWVPTANNIADEATKWKLTSQYCVPRRWYEGPEFLHRPRNEWPKERDDEPDPDDEEQEVRCLHINVTPKPDDLTPDFDRFSKLGRILRTQVWVLRFFYHKHIKTGISPEELDDAQTYLIRSVQMEAYHDDIKALKESRKLSSNSKLRKLSPFIDTQSIIRMRSRLQNAEYLTYAQRCPIILPRKHKFTELLISSFHQQMYHQNHATVVNEIKQRYYIPRLRGCLKTVRANCARCRIRNARPEVPEMAELPRSRMAARMRPFTFVGVDYFGPMTVKHGRRVEKKWGAIFTCLTTRAVHLELAPALSTDAFILVLRAFIGRRGMPTEIYSDNGTNFRGAEAELRKILQNISKEAQSRFASISWKFNPPAAPHMGGAWERLVRSVKNALNYALPERNPSEDLLRCCLIEIENMINSRPLTYVETERDRLEALTPNHFLLGSSSGTKPFGNFTDEVHVLRAEWKRQQAITRDFWTRWITEYLPSISQRTRWYEKTLPLQVGDVVAVVQTEIPYTWKLGRIETIKKNSDGSVRQADVRTASEIIRRPASKLAVLVKDQRELSDPVGCSTGGSVADGDTFHGRGRKLGKSKVASAEQQFSKNS